MLLVANSTPMVDLDSRLNSLRVNLDSKLLFPTPESPIRTTERRRDICQDQLSHYHSDQRRSIDGTNTYTDRELIDKLFVELA